MPKGKKIVSDKVMKDGTEFYIKPSQNSVFDRKGGKVGKFSFMKTKSYLEILI